MTDHNRRKIPEFQNREEEAKFWDTHSFADYWDELEPVEVVYKPALSEVLPVRFDKKTINDLREKAAMKGVGATTLVRMWILERLQGGSSYHL